jgi:hypothetical protein
MKERESVFQILPFVVGMFISACHIITDIDNHRIILWSFDVGGFGCLSIMNIL